MRGRILHWVVFLPGLASFISTHSLAADLPDLFPLAAQIGNPVVSPPNPVVTVIWGVTNQGVGTASGSWFDSILVASNGVPDLDASFVQLQQSYGPLAAAGSYWRTNAFQLPITQSGRYSLIFRSDWGNTIAESDESNNRLAISLDFQSTPADLAPIALQLPTVVTGPPNPSITVVWGITNQGSGTALGFWSDLLYLSTNATFEPGDYSVTFGSEQGPVPPGGFYWRTNSVQLPVTQDGTYYLVLVADQWNNLFEANTNNNQIALPITVHVLPPDLAPLAVKVLGPTVTPPRPIVSVAWGITNQGPGVAIDKYTWRDTLYFSTNAVFDSTAIYLLSTSELGPIDAGGQYWQTNQLLLPIVTSGTYYLILKVNEFDLLFETNKDNNTLVTPITFLIQPPDLAVDSSRIPRTVTTTPNPFFTFSYGVTNQGVGAALGSWYDAAIFSTNFPPNWWDTGTADLDFGPLLPGAAFWHTNTLQLPLTKSGTYNLVLEADENNTLIESDKSNNVTIVPINFTVLPSDLAPIGVSLPTLVTSTPNPVLTLSWSVTNQGPGSLPISPGWSDAVYFSTNGVMDGSQVRIWSTYTNGPLPAKGSYRIQAQITVPAIQSGTYFLSVAADADNALFESNEANNVVTLPISFKILQPDLVPLSLQAPAHFTGPPTPVMTVSWSVTNAGVGSAIGGWGDALFLSTDNVLDGMDSPLTTSYQPGPLRPGDTYQVTNSVTLPIVTEGSYFLILQTDPWNTVFESNPSNNILSKPINITIQPPDLAALLLLAPSAVTSPPNPSITLVWGVTNQGIGPAIQHGTWRDAIWISTNSTLDSAQLATDFAHPSDLDPGGVYWQTNSVRLPVTISGTYYLFVQVDWYNQIYELNKSNNVAMVPITFVIEPPDLRPIALERPSRLGGPPNPTLTVAWGITNQGLGAAGASGGWTDELFLSRTPTLDYAAIPVLRNGEGQLLMPGDRYWRTNTVTLPVTTSAIYYLILKTDADDNLFELNESNNVVSLPIQITILPPDLAILGLQVASMVDGPANPRLLVSWGVTNLGPGPALGSWLDELDVSSERNPEFSARSVATSYRNGPIPSGGLYWVTNSVRVPITQDGTYNLTLRVNAGYGSYQSIYEANLTNNTLVVPVSFKVSLPDLSPILLSVPSQISGPPNPKVVISYGVTNQGAGPAIGWDSWYDQLYVSSNPVADYSAIPFGNPEYETGPVSAAHMYWRTRTLQLPLTQSGDYYIFLQADNSNGLPESNETNNFLEARFHFTLEPPDLAPVALLAPAVVTGPPNPRVTLVWGVTNQGIGLAQGLYGYWNDQLFLSDDPELDGADRFVQGTSETGPLQPGGSYWRTNTFQLPLTQSGTNYLIFKTDANDWIPELDESNNIAVTPIVFNLQYADLKPIALLAPRVVNDSTSPLVTIAWGVTNQGPGAAPAWWSDSLYLTADPDNPALGLFLGGQYQSHDVPAGTDYWFTNIFALPAGLTGDQYLVLKVDDSSVFPFESDKSNNNLATPITLNITPPDLAPIALQVSDSAQSGGPYLTIVWGITNLGPGIARTSSQPWADNLSLSTPTITNSLSYFLGSWAETGPILPGGSYWRTNTVRVPVNTSGTYSLVLTVNAFDFMNEQVLDNNTLTAKAVIDLKSPDLAPIALEVPTSITAPPFPVVPIVWGVTNLGPGAATPGPYWDRWGDALFISTNSTFDGRSEQFVLETEETNFVSAGRSYWRTNLVQLPLTHSGHYHLIFEAGAYGLDESNAANNEISVPLDFTVQYPDLAIASWQAPTQMASQPWPTLTFVVGITNQGQGMAAGHPAWADAVYLSQTPFLDEQSRQVGWWARSNSLAPGAILWETNTVNLQVVDSADYFLIFVTDEGNSLGEEQLSNNVVMSPFSLNLSAPADLAVDVFQAPPLVIGTAKPTVTLISHVLNQGLGAATGSWTDTISEAVSSSGYPGPSRDLISRLETLTLQPGEGYWRTNILQLPEMQSGQYVLSFASDVAATLYETDRDNNKASSTIQFALSAPDPPGVGLGRFLPNGSFVFPVYGSFGTPYALQFSTNLVDWQLSYGFYCTSSPLYLTDPQASSATSRFYRVVTTQNGFLTLEPRLGPPNHPGPPIPGPGASH
ncbi:MAG TPA: CARDB domain-containing protein [Verrucomicrobiae bacterium]|nr:CARDB domain-containing protein [Verrucomicrobiae bacterium]